MPWFHYDARREDGTAISGQIEAATVTEALARLDDASLEVQAVRQADHKPSSSFSSRRQTAIPPQAWATLEPHFQQLLESNRPFVEALRAFAQESAPDSTRRRLLTIADDLESGKTALEVFGIGCQVDPLLISVLCAGSEQAGRHRTLPALLDNLRSAMRIRRQIWKVQAYPALLAQILFVFAVFMWGMITPQFRSIYEDFQIALPAPTRFVLSARPAVLCGLAIVTLLFITWLFRDKLVSPSTRESLACRVPVLGQVFRYALLAKFAHTLAALLSIDAPLRPSIETSGRGALPAFLHPAVDWVAGQVDAGSVEPVRRLGSFPATLVYACQPGQPRSAQVTLLRALAQEYEARAELQLRWFGRLYEPLFIVLIGGVVAFTLVSLFLPLLALVQNLSG